MPTNKKSAFAGQGKGWRKGVKGIGVKKKPHEGEPLHTQFEVSDADGLAENGEERLAASDQKKEASQAVEGSGDSETETDSGREDATPPQQRPGKPFEPGPPLGAKLEVSGIPSEPESEASDDEIDEETLEGRAVLRRRGAREMGDLYRDECLAFCGELLTLQKQWRKDFEAPAPGYVETPLEPLFDESREEPSFAPASEPPPYVALFKKFHAREIEQAEKPVWQKSEGGNLFMRGDSGKLVIRRKKLKKLKKRKHVKKSEKDGNLEKEESKDDGNEHEMRVDQDGVLVRRRKTRKDKGVAKTHGKYVQSGGDGQDGETVLHLTPEEEDLNKLRRMILNELVTSVESGPIDAPRSRAAWTEQERESFKRSLFLFGLGRLQKVQRHMKQCLKKSQQLLGDVTDACYQLLEQCLAYIGGSDLTLTQKRMQDLLKRRTRGDEVEVGPEVAARVGVFAKLPTNAKSWVRRLQLLDGLDHALHVCGSRTTQKEAFKIILLIAEDGTKPAPWWTRNADVALMLGVYRHGYANYEAIRLDPEFAEAFAPALEEEGAADKVRRRRRRKKHQEGDANEGLVADSFIESLVEGDLGDEKEREGGLAEPSAFVPLLEMKSAEKRPVIDLDLNAPAEDGSPRGQEQVIGGEAVGKAESATPNPVNAQADVGSTPPEDEGPEKKRKREDGTEDGGEKDGSVNGWPASVPLTLRLKRLISHLARGLKKPAAVNLHKEEAPSQAPQKTAKRPTWSKKEKQDLVRALTAFGLPETPDGRPDWTALLKAAGLSRKSETGALSCFEELLAEATAVLRENKALRKRQRKPVKHMLTCTCAHCKQSRLESLPPAQQKARRREDQTGELGPPTLINVISAKKLLDRIETLEILRRALTLIPGDWTSKELGFYRTADLPRWWQAGLHDREFSLGVIKHGIGNWGPIGGDPELAFPQPEDFKNDAPEGEIRPEETGDAVVTSANVAGDVMATSAETRETGGTKESSVDPPGGGWAFPGSKVLLRRLKYITQILKRSVARLQKKVQPPAELQAKREGPKAPKGQGQESAVDGARKPKKRRRSITDEEKGETPVPLKQPSTTIEEPAVLLPQPTGSDQATLSGQQQEANLGGQILGMSQDALKPPIEEAAIIVEHSGPL